MTFTHARARLLEPPQPSLPPEAVPVWMDQVQAHAWELTLSGCIVRVNIPLAIPTRHFLRLPLLDVGWVTVPGIASAIVRTGRRSTDPRDIRFHFIHDGGGTDALAALFHLVGSARR